MKFIRIDKKGTWKDREHISSFATYDGDYKNKTEDDYGYLEKGISCYSLKNIVEGIENLYSYWTEIAMWDTSEQFKGFQITIFKGNKIDEYGSDGEDLAICTNTIKEIDAQSFMIDLFAAKEKIEAYEEGWDDEEQITKEEYNTILLNLIK